MYLMIKVSMSNQIQSLRSIVTKSQKLVFCGLLGSLPIFLNPSFAAASESLTTVEKGLQLEPPAIQTMVRDGLSIEFKVSPDNSQDEVMQGKYADVEFRISDVQSGEPVKGIYPAVWLDIAKPWEQPDADASISCKERVQLYMQGIGGVRPLVDLNSYFVLVLNQDATVSVIDPIIGVGGITKLYASINLLSAGVEWAKTVDEKYMYISMPAKDKVAMVDLTTFKVTTNIDAGDNPVRVALQPDEKYLWVANNHRDGSRSGVSIIDVANQSKLKFIATGSGHHELAFSHDSRFAYVSNRNDGSISVIDTEKLEKIKTLQVSNQPIGLAFSEKSESLYVTDGQSGKIVVIDMNSNTIKKRIDVKVGVGPIGISQDGRWVIAANSEEDEVYTVDAATNELMHTLPVGRKPYQLAFSRAFVYIRSLGSERVSMIELNHLNGNKKVAVSDFQAGSNAPGKMRDISLASAIHEAPGEAAVLVVSPSDNTVYYYMEGMNAPMGNFRNYGHRPRAVQVADRTLREDEDGVYHAKVRIPAAGTYDVAFLMESPSILHCFNMTAVPDPTQLKQLAAGIEFIDRTGKVNANEPVKIRFRLKDPKTGKHNLNLKDVRVRYYRAPAFDRREEFVQDVGEGIYELETQLANPGVYYFFVSSPSSNLKFGDTRFQTVQVTRSDAGNMSN